MNDRNRIILNSYFNIILDIFLHWHILYSYLILNPFAIYTTCVSPKGKEFVQFFLKLPVNSYGEKNWFIPLWLVPSSISTRLKNKFISSDYLLSIDMRLFEKETLTDEIRESSDAIVIYFYQLQNWIITFTGKLIFITVRFITFINQINS